MAIEGLMVEQSASAAGNTLERFKPGNPDVNEAVGVTLEAYKILGYAGDAEAAEESLTSAFEAPANLGYDGRLHVPVPKAVSFKQLLAAAEGKKPADVGAAYVYPNLWTPGTEKKSYTDDELNQAPAEAFGRLALFAADSDESDLDPLLHYTDSELPFDDYAKERWGGKSTQLAEVGKAQAEFEDKHPDFNLTMMNHRDFALFALMDRIRGVKPDSAEFVLNRGWMRVAGALGRRSVDGESIVGALSSNDGQLRFVRGDGNGNSSIGVRLSAGQNQT